jgi:hypothetical protein
LKLRAANGGMLGMAGASMVRIQLPGTKHGFLQEVHVASKGSMPGSLKLLGNSFWKRCNAKLDWEEGTVTGTTPEGERFCLKVNYGNQAECMYTAVIDDKIMQEQQAMGATAVRSPATIITTIMLVPNQYDSMMMECDKDMGKEEMLHWNPAEVSTSANNAETGTDRDFSCCKPTQENFVTSGSVNPEWYRRKGMSIHNGTITNDGDHMVAHSPDSKRRSGSNVNA